MPLLVDGNNLLHRLPKPSRTRSAVRALVLDATRHERMSVVVAFDGPPPAGSPERELLGRVTVVYPAPPPPMTVIIGRPGTERAHGGRDRCRKLAGRARERGAAVRTLGEWSARPRPAPPRTRAEAKLSSSEVAEWEEVFKGGRKKAP
jgi:hypothetical protein